MSASVKPNLNKQPFLRMAGPGEQEKKVSQELYQKVSVSYFLPEPQRNLWRRGCQKKKVKACLDIPGKLSLFPQHLSELFTWHLETRISRLFCVNHSEEKGKCSWAALFRIIFMRKYIICNCVLACSSVWWLLACFQGCCCWTRQCLNFYQIPCVVRSGRFEKTWEKYKLFGSDGLHFY